MPATEVVLATSIPPPKAAVADAAALRRARWAELCWESWPAPGWHIMTLNPAVEIPLLPALPPEIETCLASGDVTAAFGRSGAFIGEALTEAAARGAAIVGVINADIRLTLSSDERRAIAARARDEILLFNRMDLAHPGQAEGPFYRYGYDFVLMPAHFASRLESGGFAFGVPWWDYWLALDALLQRLPVAVVQCAGVRHLLHPQMWSPPLWRAALRRMLLCLGRRRSALSALGLGATTEALLDLLLRLEDGADDGIGLNEIIERAATRLGLEIVRLAELSAWRLG